MKLNIKNQKFTNGFSLLEMLIYIAIMALILVVIVNTLSAIILSQKKIKNHRVIEHSVAVAFERMTREIKGAERINFEQSAFGGHPGRLVLEVKNSLGEAREIEFFVENEVLKFKDGDLVSPIIDPNARANSLVFYSVFNNGVQAVRINLDLQAGTGQFQKTETFYTTALLRN